MANKFRWLSVFCVLSTCCFGFYSLDHLRGDQPAASGTQKSANPGRDAKSQSQKALEQLNSIVGGWRGVGQPVRNSAKGSWTETGEWVWEIKKDRVGLRYQVTDGKLLSSALLTYDPEQKLFSLAATLPDKTERRYSGTLADNKLSLESAADSAGNIHQILITCLNDKRTLVLYQSRKAEQERFVRVAEVGYTRQGTRLAVEGAGEPECIVTGGKGTSSIVYKGKTYYFCCTGCRDAFNDDPEGIIAEAAKKAAKKKVGG